MPKQSREDSDSKAQREKRAKVEKTSLGSPIDPQLFEAENLSKLKEAYKVSGPYPHVRVDQLCLVDRAIAIQNEAKHCLKADFKETDIFKVYQTPDFANLVTSHNDTSDEEEEEEDENGLQSTVAMAKKWHAPNLVALRDAIYSEDFRNFVSDLAGCGKLEDKPDLSCNVYAEGGHLLCHDDVINTRRISFIIYLTDPEDEWTVEDGGTLELYPISKEKGIGFPETTPVKNVLPKFNSMFFFTVVPGQSFHAVQEVFATGKPRLSISGWYHGKEPPPGMEFATRAQLGANADATSALVPWKRFAEETSDSKAEEEQEEDDEDDEELEPITLSKEDLDHLSKWMNPQYLDIEILTQLRSRFLEPENGSAVQLDEFLLPDISIKIQKAINAADASDGLGFINKSNKKASLDPESAICYESGIGGGWKAAGPVHKQRFLYLDHHTVKEPSSCADGENKAEKNPLETIQKDLIESESFVRWLNQVTCFKILQGRSLTRRFRPGLDYTVAHLGTLATGGKSALDATLCFVNDGEVREINKGKSSKSSKKNAAKPKEKSELWHLWDGGEVGGFECYVEVEEDHSKLDGEDGEQRDAPEVYDSRSALESGEGGSSSSSQRRSKQQGGGGKSGEQGEEEEDEEEFDSEDEEEAGGTLLSVQARFNTLSLVTRDEGVMRFVKYVSSFAPGSRWDVATEFQVE